MKQVLKNIFTRNIGWKILSLIIAVGFWLIVVNLIDPTTKRTFEGIPVEILNETAITSADQVYEVESGDTVNVTITSKRSLVERLQAKDFVATADLSDLSPVNAVSIQVKLKKNPENVSYELSWNNSVLKVKLEKRITEKYKVQVKSIGETEEGYVLGDVTVKPNIIEVSGGESKMKSIDHVGVTVELSGQSEKFSTKATPMAYNSAGDVIDSSKLTFSVTEVKVTVGVRQTMEVPVEVTTTGEPAEGYHLIQTDRQPESIRVSSDDPSLLTRDLVIRLEVDIEGATADVEKEIDITDRLGEGYIIEDDTTVVSVRCEIGKSGERSFYLTGNDVEVLNSPQNYSVSLLDPERRYEVELSGSNEKLKTVEIKDLNASIDIGNLGEGTHSVAVRFDPPEGVRIKNSISIEISIAKIESEETEEPETTEEPVPTEEE